MPFHNKQPAESTPKPKPTWGEEPEGRQQQHRDGDRRPQHDGNRRPQHDGDRRPQHHNSEPREQKTPCSFGETCRFVNSEKGCRDYHPLEHIICRWDNTCTRQGCQYIHPSRAKGSDAPSQPTERLERPARSERTAPFQNVERPRPDRQPLMKAKQDNPVSTDDAIRLIREQLAALEKTKKIEDFRKQQQAELEQFIAQQAEALESFIQKNQ